MANIHSRAPREVEQIFCGVCISDELLCLLNPASVLSFHRCRFLDDTFHPEHHLSICTWGTYLVTALTYSFLYPLRPTRLIKTHPDKPNSFSSVLKQMNRSGKKRWPCRSIYFKLMIPGLLKEYSGLPPSPTVFPWVVLSESPHFLFLL